MKLRLLMLVSSLILLFGKITFAEQVEIPVEALLAPAHGYEEKNTIQAVMYGSLPNSCYTLGEYKIERDVRHKIVRIHQFANRDRVGICAQDNMLPPHMTMAIPFVNEVAIGQLIMGDYTLIFKKAGSGLSTRSLNVAPNVTLTVDSLPYALVSNVSVPELNTGKDEIVATISGMLTTTCTELNDEVTISKEGDVFVLLPTIKLKPNVMCAESLVPFTKKVNLGNASAGRYLVHTRSMNGKAINRVIEVGR